MNKKGAVSGGVIILILAGLLLTGKNLMSTHQPCENHTDCPPGEYCYLYSGRCQDLKPEGDFCNADYQCLSGSCINNACTEGSVTTTTVTDSYEQCTNYPNCESCSLDSDCISYPYQYCKNEKCYTVKPNGYSCTRNSECVHNNCNYGICGNCINEGGSCQSTQQCCTGNCEFGVCVPYPDNPTDCDDECKQRGYDIGECRFNDIGIDGEYEYIGNIGCPFPNSCYCISGFTTTTIHDTTTTIHDGGICNSLVTGMEVGMKTCIKVSHQEPYTGESYQGQVVECVLGSDGLPDLYYGEKCKYGCKKTSVLNEFECKSEPIIKCTFGTEKEHQCDTEYFHVWKYCNSEGYWENMREECTGGTMCRRESLLSLTFGCYDVLPMFCDDIIYEDECALAEECEWIDDECIPKEEVCDNEWIDKIHNALDVSCTIAWIIVISFVAFIFLYMNRGGSKPQIIVMKS